MDMVWVLIIALISPSGPTNVTTHEFVGENACIFASLVVERGMSANGGHYMQAKCVPKTEWGLK